MSTISQAPKVNTARTLHIQPVNLLVIAVLVLGVALIAVNASAPAAGPIDNSAYVLYRQGEWLSVPILPSNAEGYHLFRLSEWASVNIPTIAMDMTAYHLSERTLLPIVVTDLFIANRLSEHALLDQQVGLKIFQDSERTTRPVKFTAYQLSEWFGK